MKQDTRRRERAASIIRRAVAETLARDFNDPRMRAAMISVTRVEAAADLRSAKVFFSLLGTEAQQRTAWRGLIKARGLIQSHAGDTLGTRATPELTFHPDESLKNVFTVTQLIKDAMAELGENGAAAGGDDDDDDGEDDGEDEGDHGEPTGKPAGEPTPAPTDARAADATTETGDPPKTATKSDGGLAPART